MIYIGISSVSKKELKKHKAKNIFVTGKALSLSKKKAKLPPGESIVRSGEFMFLSVIV